MVAEKPPTQQLEVVNNNDCYAGRLVLYYDKWREITSNRFVLNTISGYKIPFHTVPQQSHIPAQVNTSDTENMIIDQLIDQLLSIGAIEQAKESRGQFISPIFIVPKSSGSYRLVLNLKELNTYVQNEHFKMEDYRTVCSILGRKSYMSTLDLKDAFHLIPVEKGYRQFLRFIWKGKLYEYTCLPFGLSTAPRVFSKVIKPVLNVLRKRGLKSVGYLDDFLLFGNDRQSCIENFQCTKSLFLSLGFVINDQKSNSTPEQKKSYLGFIFDSVGMKIYLPILKWNKIKSLATEAISKPKHTILFLSQLIGNLVAASPAVRYGFIYIKQLEYEKSLALANNDRNFKDSMSLSVEAIQDLNWWIQFDPTKGCPIRDDSFDVEIYSDASLTGWGSHLGEQIAKGYWSFEEKKYHINVLEILAAFNALRSFKLSNNSSILLRLDSSTAIAYVNKQGGCRSIDCQSIAKKLWKWCEAKNIWIYASYINTKDNIIADYFSRSELDSSDFMLDKNVYSQICLSLGNPSIDLFASETTAQCQRFCSWFPSPSCHAVDAFSVFWEHNFYAFPPFCLIPRVLKKIKTDCTKGIVVVPKWTGQSWYPDYLSMCSSKILEFGPVDNLLFSPYSRKSHPLSKTLVLMVAILSGDSLKL